MKQYVISMSIDDAFIVEAANEKTILNNPKNTYKIVYRDMKYKFMDLEEEAKREIGFQKSMPDPRVLIDHKNTVEDILALPQSKGKKREWITSLLEIIRMAPKERQEAQIKRYENAHSKSEDDLYQEILEDFKSKGKNYTPKRIPHLMENEILMGMPQAGYKIGVREFETMDAALQELFDAWTRKGKYKNAKLEDFFR